MATSKTIAGLIGPTLVAIAAGMLLNIGSFPELAEQVSRDPALIFVSGILLFVAGRRMYPGRRYGVTAMTRCPKVSQNA